MTWQDGMTDLKPNLAKYFILAKVYMILDSISNVLGVAFRASVQVLAPSHRSDSKAWHSV